MVSSWNHEKEGIRSRLKGEMVREVGGANDYGQEEDHKRMGGQKFLRKRKYKWSKSNTKT